MTHEPLHTVIVLTQLCEEGHVSCTLKTSFVVRALFLPNCVKRVNPAGTPRYRNGTESFFGLKGRPSVVRDVNIHNQPAIGYKYRLSQKNFIVSLHFLLYTCSTFPCLHAALSHSPLFELLRLEGASIGCAGCKHSQPTRPADET
jgi:hypothetical protein